MPRPDSLNDAWDKAFASPGTPVDIGDTVVCDVCDEDYTQRPDIGGFIFGSYAYCPTCATKHLPDIVRAMEETAIKARCPADQSFADFIRAYRAGRGGNTILVNKGEDEDVLWPADEDLGALLDDDDDDWMADDDPAF